MEMHECDNNFIFFTTQMCINTLLMSHVGKNPCLTTLFSRGENEFLLSKQQVEHQPQQCKHNVVHVGW